MAETSAPSELGKVTFYVKTGGQKWTLTLPLDTTTIDLKNKLATDEYANVPATSQRLIYSGKVLKDNETLATHNVKEGNTMHLVKSAASNQRQNPASQTTSTSDSSSQVPPNAGVPQNLASGTGNDPLAGLTGARYAGFAGLPSLESLANPPTPDEMLRRLQDPNFAQQMNEALQNPQMIDMMINMNPQLRAMGPQARQMLQSEQFRRMMTNPEALRSMMQLQNSMGMGGGMFGGGGNPFGMDGGQQAFPAPGVTNPAEQGQTRDQTQTTTQGGQQAQNPFGSMFGGANPFGLPPPSGNPSDANQQNNPFMALLNPSLFGQQPGQGPAAGGDANNPSSPNANQQPNPFANPFSNPLLAQLLGGGGMGGFGAPPDNRPPEERFSTQLRQLNEMGFHDFDRNVQALNRSGGDVNGALEWLFSQPQ